MKQFGFPGFAILLATIAPVTWADATVSYHTDIQTTGLDPNAPLIQMNQGLVKLSSDPVDDAVFQVPAAVPQFKQ